MTALDLVTLAVLAWFGSRLVISFRRSVAGGARARSLELLRGLRARHLLPVPLVLAAVIVVAYALTSLPILRFGWWTAIGGQGNPVFGVTERTAGTLFELVVPIVFIALLAPALPLLVEREEVLFRLGAEAWSPVKRAGKVVLFGAVHAVVGIPIGTALALSIGGAWFMLAYLRVFRSSGSRRAALDESIRCHLAYNGTIIVLVALVLAWEVVLVVAGG